MKTFKKHYLQQICILHMYPSGCKHTKQETLGKLESEHFIAPVTSKINIIKKEDGVLAFSNLSSFIPISVEKVVNVDALESKYRNSFLANAVVSLNMKDRIGSGIKRMFLNQKNKYFPLSDHEISSNQVLLNKTDERKILYLYTKPTRHDYPSLGNY